MNAERWRPIPGYEGSYEVSDLGRVRSLDRMDARGRTRTGRLLRLRRTTRNHLAVALYKDLTRRDYQVHHLVLVTFVGSRPPGTEGCHWNDDPTDNRLDNLRWDTRSANCLDSVRNGGHARAGKTHCPSGHAYTPENTYVYPNSKRACRECRRIYRETHADERRAKGREFMRRKRAAERSAASKAA